MKNGAVAKSDGMETDMQDETFPFSFFRESGEGCVLKPHRHPGSMEILEIVEGEARVGIGTTTLSATTGDFFYIPADMMHRAEAVGGNLTVRGLVFETSILEANMQSFDTEILYMFYVQSKNRITVFRPSHGVYDVLANYMQDSCDEFLGKDVCYKLPIRANIYLMMTALLRHYCGLKDEQERMVYHNVLRMRPILEHIEGHYKEKIYIDRLAEQMMVSPDYFTKMFRESIGKTPVDYINDLRIHRSLELLAEGNSTMTEIAEETGFANANYFHKIFKQYMDMRPLAYRKLAR